jgi:ferredoxin/flavodoxin---NADP+ reductase
MKVRVEEGRMPEVELNAQVLQKFEVSPGLAIFRIAPAGWPLPSFVPGQFGVLGLSKDAPRWAYADPEDPNLKIPNVIRRSYSVSSSSKQNEYLEFLITLVRSGALTPRLWSLEPGDRVWLGPKFTGMFTLDQVPADANVILIATGTGLAPYMSMLRTHMRAGEARRFAVLHGASNSWDLAYRDELLGLQMDYPNFAYIPIITIPERERSPWKGATGFIEDLWRNGVVENAWKLVPDPSHTHVFLCGNPTMVENMTEILTGEGYSEHTPRQTGEIHREKYW